MTRTTITFSLDTEIDGDLMAWLDGHPARGRSGAIREALRASIAGGGLTLGDVYQAIKAIEQRIGRGAVVSGGDPTPEEEPPTAAAALDSLGL